MFQLGHLWSPYLLRPKPKKSEDPSLLVFSSEPLRSERLPPVKFGVPTFRNRSIPLIPLLLPVLLVLQAVVFGTATVALWPSVADVWSCLIIDRQRLPNDQNPGTLLFTPAKTDKWIFIPPVPMVVYLKPWAHTSDFIWFHVISHQHDPIVVG